MTLTKAAREGGLCFLRRARGRRFEAVGIVPAQIAHD
jgi:hypothetical protein